MSSPNLVSIESLSHPALEPYFRIRERDLVGRQGCFVAEGEVVVRVLLASRRHRVRSLLVERRRVPAIADALAALGPEVPVLVVPQAVMDKATGFSIHRGILALGERPPDVSVSELALRPGPVVALVGLTNHDNVGGIFRNAAAFGAAGVVLDDATCDPLYRKAIRVSAGAALVVPFARAGSAEMLLDALAGAGVVPIALTPRGDETIAAVGQSLARTARAALVLGTEGPGLPDDVLARCRRVRIPMVAGFDSLNVAAASAIALHEMSGLR